MAVQVDGDFASVLEEWFVLLDEADLTIRVTSGFRSPRQQRAIFSRLGRRGLAARPGRSFHEYGLALDFVTVPRTATTMRRAGELAESVGLRWGGRFRTPDPVHVDAGHFITITEARSQGFPGDLVEVE